MDATDSWIAVHPSYLRAVSYRSERGELNRGWEFPLSWLLPGDRITIHNTGCHEDPDPATLMGGSLKVHRVVTPGYA